MKCKTFTRDFWICLLAFIFVIIIICFFPSWFIKSGAINFNETGQIGDTIGGIMGPFVAIAASILTFLAFWVQFKANTIQRTDVQIERFENNLFNYFQLLNSQISDINIPNVGNNKQSFHFMFYEFKSICYYLQNHKISESKDINTIFKCAYNIFINGVSHSDTKRIKEDNRKISTCFYDEFELCKINNYFYNFNQYKYLNKQNGKVQYLRDYNTLNIKLFDGHRLHLVPFYRSICIIIKYMYDEIYGNHYIGCNEKDTMFEFYINLLCSQLSEHQISLLKIIYVFGNSEYHKYFVENNGVKLFFEVYIQNYINTTTMDCKKWNFKK